MGLRGLAPSFWCHTASVGVCRLGVLTETWAVVWQENLIPLSGSCRLGVEDASAKHSGFWVQ